MTTRLERDIQRSTLWVFFTASKCFAFSVKGTKLGMPAFPDNATIFHNNRTYHGIGVYPATTTPRQLKCTRHIAFIRRRTFQILSVAFIYPRRQFIDQGTTFTRAANSSRFSFRFIISFRQDATPPFFSNTANTISGNDVGKVLS